jgi:O-antigen/teichoic acid export membrane protein
MAGAGARVFGGRVATLFVTQATTAAVGLVNAVVVARLLGPAAKGEYYLALLAPTTLLVLGQLGLPSAYGYFAARGLTRGLVRDAVIVALLLAGASGALTIVLMPALRETVLRALPERDALLGLLALPLLFLTNFGQTIVLGRLVVRPFAIVSIAHVLAATVALVVFIGILGLGVEGAIVAFLVYSTIPAIGFLLVGRRATADPQGTAGRASVGDLLRYGLRLYPGSITSFFSYRADVYLLSWLLVSPDVPLGLYSLAVGIAEMVFFFPNAVSSVFFPHVAGSKREDVDHQLPIVSRVTILATAGAAIALVPVAIVLVGVFLPAYTDCLPALFILLPGVVSLSAAKVQSGYLSGLGHTGTTSLIAIVTFVLNVACNLVLIPAFGIAGAATASLVSYTASTLLSGLACRALSHASIRAQLVPTFADVRFLRDRVIELIVAVLASLRERRARAAT